MLIRSIRSLLVLLLSGILLETPTQGDPPSEKVHIHYYGWYGNPAIDGDWSHWNHAVLPKSGPISDHHRPPEDIGSPFYPEIGLYSSLDPTTVRTHLDQIAKAGIGVVNFSWWGPANHDDRVLELLMGEAEKKGLKVNFHLEPYPGRNASSVKENLRYLIAKYKDSPALYRDPTRENLPMFYVYDSYLTPTEEWAAVLRPEAPETIRGTDHDAVMIALYVKERDKSLLSEGGFDGIYTYFATKGFTQGSTPENWRELREWTRALGKLFIPSVGPGYDDLPIRPWNEANFRSREGGNYYATMFESAIDVNPDRISITSFNEWHEGTQIEPAVPEKNQAREYRDYRPLEPEGYLKLTQERVAKFEESLKKSE